MNICSFSIVIIGIFCSNIRYVVGNDALPYERLEDGERTTQAIDEAAGNLPMNEQFNSSPIMNINNIKLHLNLSKPLEKIRNKLVGLKNEKQESIDDKRDINLNMNIILDDDNKSQVPQEGQGYGPEMQQPYPDEYQNELESCVKQCCIRHQLPLKCLQEQFESRRDSDHNETHQVSSMILSKDCNEYHYILDDCKLECMEEEKVYGYESAYGPAPSARSASTYELSPSDQEPCLYKCCVDHGLPVECINEETQSLKTDTLNDTHKAVEMIISDNCHVFAKILQDCKASCIPRKKVDCQWSLWRKDGECSVTCGSGKQNLIRSKIKEEENGGYCDNKSRMMEICVLPPCPDQCPFHFNVVNGKFGPWSPYSKCTKTCGTGIQNRNRKCNNPPPSAGGKDCVGPAYETRKCSTNDCPVDGKFGPWGAYSTCTKTCGTGLQKRDRKCSNPPPSAGGKDCIGARQEAKKCNTHPCPVNGKFGPWGPFSACTKTCGAGTQKRERKCNSPPPSAGGKDCIGRSVEINNCNTDGCPVDCKWSSWNTDKCSASCGKGIRLKRRSKLVNEKNGGICSGHSDEREDCNIKDCPVDCEWSEWQRGECSVSCDGGERRNKRVKVIEERDGGKCEGSSVMQEYCNTYPCPTTSTTTTTTFATTESPDTCLLRCCEENKLPVDCLEEEFETKQVSQINGTHHIIRIVRSEKCAAFSFIMAECKSTCLGSITMAPETWS